MKTVFISIIRFYRRFLSLDHGYLGYIIPHRGPICRYQPSCSLYMIQAIEKYGSIKGIWLGLKRIGRCHPWAGFGPDPVP